MFCCALLRCCASLESDWGADQPGVTPPVTASCVDIETKSELTRGATVVDHLRVTGLEPSTDVVLEASRERFLEILYSSVR